MVEFTYQMVLSTLQTVALLVGITYYIMTLQNQLKSRQAQVYTQIWSKFSDPEFLDRYYEVQSHEWTDFEDYFEKYASMRNTDTKQFARNVSVGVMLEGIGVLVKRGFLNPLYVADLMSTIVVGYWEKRSDMIKALRERWGNPRIYTQIEYLYDKIKPIVEER